MICENTKDINVLHVACSDKERHLPPTSAAIAIMKLSLEKNGQINPIGVYPITRNTYRLISGATRFRAATELGWQKIRASIWSGTDIDFQLHELTENVDRRELSGKLRKEMKAKIKALQKLRLANVSQPRAVAARKVDIAKPPDNKAYRKAQCAAAQRRKLVRTLITTRFPLTRRLRPIIAISKIRNQENKY